MAFHITINVYSVLRFDAICLVRKRIFSRSRSMVRDSAATRCLDASPNKRRETSCVCEWRKWRSIATSFTMYTFLFLF